MSPAHNRENSAPFLPRFIFSMSGASSMDTAPGGAVRASVGLSATFRVSACNSSYKAVTASCASRKGFAGPSQGLPVMVKYRARSYISPRGFLTASPGSLPRQRMCRRPCIQLAALYAVVEVHTDDTAAVELKAHALIMPGVYLCRGRGKVGPCVRLSRFGRIPCAGIVWAFPCLARRSPAHPLR